MAKILCFDDEAKDKLSTVIQYLKEDCFHDLEVVETLSEAENKISTKVFDVLLLDTRIIPEKCTGVSGYEDKEWNRTGVRLIERIRKNKILDAATPSNVPIIVLTAVVHPPTLKEIESFGSIANLFIRVIQKPPRLIDIRKAIEEALEYNIGKEE